MKKDEEIRRLYVLLRDYDQQEIAEVGARVHAACITARPEDAEERARAITLDVLRLRHRGLHSDWELHHQLFPDYGSARRAHDRA